MNQLEIMAIATQIMWGLTCLVGGFLVLGVLGWAYEKFEDIIKMLFASIVAVILVVAVLGILGYFLYELGGWARGFL